MSTRRVVFKQSYDDGPWYIFIDVNEQGLRRETWVRISLDGRGQVDLTPGCLYLVKMPCGAQKYFIMPEYDLDFKDIDWAETPQSASSS